MKRPNFGSGRCLLTRSPRHWAHARWNGSLGLIGHVCVYLDWCAAWSVVQYVRHLTGQNHKTKSPVSCRTYCTLPRRMLQSISQSLNNGFPSIFRYSAKLNICFILFLIALFSIKTDIFCVRRTSTYEWASGDRDPSTPSPRGKPGNPHCVLQPLSSLFL